MKRVQPRPSIQPFTQVPFRTSVGEAIGRISGALHVFSTVSSRLIRVAKRERVKTSPLGRARNKRPLQRKKIPDFREKRPRSRVHLASRCARTGVRWPFDTAACSCDTTFSLPFLGRPLGDDDVVHGIPRLFFVF